MYLALIKLQSIQLVFRCLIFLCEWDNYPTCKTLYYYYIITYLGLGLLNIFRPTWRYWAVCTGHAVSLLFFLFVLVFYILFIFVKSVVALLVNEFCINKVITSIKSCVSCVYKTDSCVLIFEIKGALWSFLWNSFFVT